MYNSSSIITVAYPNGGIAQLARALGSLPVVCHWFKSSYRHQPGTDTLRPENSPHFPVIPMIKTRGLDAKPGRERCLAEKKDEWTKQSEDRQRRFRDLAKSMRTNGPLVKAVKRHRPFNGGIHEFESRTGLLTLFRAQPSEAVLCEEIVTTKARERCHLWRRETQRKSATTRRLSSAG